MPPTLLTSAITAGDLIKSIRIQIPDPTFDPITLLQDTNIVPSHDGARFTAATMYLWLTEAMRETVQRANWLLEDWWAFPAVATMPTYPLDQRWHNVEAAYAYQRQCYPMPEQYTIFPAQASAQPILYGSHRRLGGLEVFYWPNPNIADPSTTLTAGISATDDILPLTSTANFLSFGYVQIDSELIQYNALDSVAQTLSVSRRGVAGTTAVTHALGATAYSCSLWVKGMRTPTLIVADTTPVECPQAFLGPIRTYVRAMVKGAEQDDQGEGRLMGMFDQQINAILSDPQWQSDPVKDGLAQVRSYGSYMPGGLANLGPFGTVIS